MIMYQMWLMCSNIILCFNFRGTKEMTQNSTHQTEHAHKQQHHKSLSVCLSVCLSVGRPANILITSSEVQQSPHPSVIDFAGSSAERPVMFHCVLVGPFAHMVDTCVAYREALKNHKTDKLSRLIDFYCIITQKAMLYEKTP